MKTKAQRIADTKKVQQKRYSKWRCMWKNMDPRRVGQLRKTNFSCGCPTCKPWKHGIGNSMKFSDKRRANDK